MCQNIERELLQKKYTEASRAARNLIDGCLQPDPENRFTWDVVFTHPFFRVNWDAFRLRRVGAPIGPDLVTWHQNPHLVKLKSDDAALPDLGVPDNLMIGFDAQTKLSMSNAGAKVESRDTQLTPEQQAVFANFGPSFVLPSHKPKESQVEGRSSAAIQNAKINVNELAESLSTALAVTS